MEKSFGISLKLNFTANTLGCYGLKRTRCYSLPLKLPCLKLYKGTIVVYLGYQFEAGTAAGREIGHGDTNANLHNFLTKVDIWAVGWDT